MSEKWLNRIIQVAAITLTLVAACQELEKPAEERKGYGKVAGIFPYDFRIPTIERFKESYWNPYESQIFTPQVFAIGWAINFYALLENLRVFGQGGVSEENFLMPTPSIKEVLTPPPAPD